MRGVRGDYRTHVPRPTDSAWPAAPAGVRRTRSLPWPASRAGRGVAILVLLGLLVGGNEVVARVDVRGVAPAVLVPASPAVAAARAAQEAEARRDRAVDDALVVQNAALAARDEGAFLSVVDPASPLFRSRHRRTFRSLRALPVDVRYRWTSRSHWYVADLGHRYGTEAFVAAVDRTYHLVGWDAHPVVETVGLTFVRRGDRWFVAGDTDAAGQVPDGGLLEPWSVGEVTVVRRPHVLVVGERRWRSRLRRLADRTEAAVGEVRRLWPSSWDGRAVVYVSPHKGFLDAWFGSGRASGSVRRTTGDLATFDAVVGPVWAGTRLAGTEGVPVAGFRVAVAPGLFDRPSRQVDQILRHELTHLANAGHGRRQRLAWVEEGTAEYVAFRGDGAVDGPGSLLRRGLPRELWGEIRAGTHRPTLSRVPREFYGGTSRQVGYRYTDAWFAVMYVADHYGEARLRRLVRAAQCEEGASAATRRRVEQRALRDVLGVDRAAFLRDVRVYQARVRDRFV